MNNPDQVAFGQKGSAFASGVNAVDIPEGKVIVAVTAITAIQLDGDDTVSETGFGQPAATDTIPEGVTIFGRFTAFKLAGGSQRAMVYFG
tara:strand:+ start:212 stop:481 length:270 start_codon:yes stop_codon:yes gene_type:complete